MQTFTAAAKLMGRPNEALDAVITMLASHGFAIVERDERSAILTGPRMTSTRQNPVTGVSRLILLVRGQELVAEAELGGVEAMQRFLWRFPLFLGLGLALLFGIGGGLLFGQKLGVGFGVPWAPGWQWLVVASGGALLPVTPWLLLAPLLSRNLARRTEAAVVTLVQNAVTLANAR